MSELALNELWQRMAAAEDRAIRFVGLGQGEASELEQRLSYAELVRRALGAAEYLRRLGFAPGERVLISTRTCPEFAVAWFGLKLLGAVPVPVPPSEVLAGRDVFAERVLPLLPHHEALIADPEDIQQIEAHAAGYRRHTLAEIYAAEPLAPTPERLRTPDAEETAFVQYTSGSTSRPKGVIITYGNIVANIVAIQAATDCHPGVDSFISWLPLYHDMGLVGMLLNCAFTTTDLVLMPPQYFARRPQRFLRLIEKYGATHCSVPNFALEWMLRAQATKPQPVRLDSMRWFGVGSEPVSCETLRRFDAVFGPMGLASSVLSPCYGLAEATLAVSISRPREAVLESQHQGAPFPGVGRPVKDMEVRIEADGAPAEVGHILVRGSSVARNAYVDGKPVPLVDERGFYDTRDLGYFSQGELVVLGRADEMFVLNGTNYFPYDIESVVRLLPGLPINRVAAFGTGKERPEVVVLVELRGAAHAGNVTDAVRRGVFERLGLRVDRVVCVAPKQVPVTTSGKIRRRAARERYERGELESIQL